MRVSEDRAGAERPSDARETDRGIATLLVAVALPPFAWSLVVPVFEAPDEPAHWQYARYLHDHWRLPLYDAEFVEANSPPLYYALMATFAAPTETPPFVIVRGPDETAASLAPPHVVLNTDRTRAVLADSSPARNAALSVITVWVCAAGRAATGSRTTGS
jgi:hypothetical protein